MANETELERLLIRMVGDSSNYTQMLDQAKSQTSSATRDIEAMGSSASGIGVSLSTLAGGFAAITAGYVSMSTVFKSISLAADAEKLEVSFATMLKGADRGKQMVKDLQDFAAATPLQMTDVLNATKTLLQFGTSGNDILKTLRQLGDAVGGDAQRFQQMALAFGQMSAAGRLMGQDLLQMINAGFNPLQEIARTSGKSMSELKNQMEHGAITMDMVKAAFASATGPGGQFFNLMEKQSKTASGLWSTMHDDIDAMLRTIGGGIVEFFRLKDVMQLVSGAAQGVTDWMKTGLPAFLTDIKPVTDELQSLFTTAWGAVKEITATAWGTIVDIANAGIVLLNDYLGSFGVAGVSMWDKVKNATKTAIQFMEFSIKNYGAVAELTWQGIILGASKAVDGIVDAFYGLVATDYAIFAAIGAYASTTWDNFFTAADNAFKQVKGSLQILQAQMEAFFHFLKTGNWTIAWEKADEKIKSIKENMAADKPMKDAGDAAGEAFNTAFSTALSSFNIGDSQMTKGLQQEFDRMSGNVGKSFDQFKKDRAKDQFLTDFFFAPDKAGKTARVAYDQGQATGQAWSKGVKHGTEHHEAALFGTQEALARIAANQDKLTKEEKPGMLGAGAFDVAQAGSQEASGRSDKSEGYLKDIKTVLEKDANRPTIDLKPANLAGAVA